MDLSENYKDLWSARFAKIVRKHNLTAKSQVDWGVLTTAFFEHLSKNQSATPSEASSTKNTTTTNNTTPKLKEGDYKKFDAMYQSLNRNTFWTLSTGTVVEDKVKELAMKLSNEHPSHSMILDTSDPVWLEYFTKSELKEIEDEKKVTLSELPKSMQTYLDCYNGLKTLDELWNEHTKHSLHPIRDADLYWVHSSVRNVLEILMHGLHKKSENMSLKPLQPELISIAPLLHYPDEKSVQKPTFFSPRNICYSALWKQEKYPMSTAQKHYMKQA
ncbi:hypothetical protein BDB00DRAFT_870427 [Zychaea mexicana]|uniref:uncharacterized protein n=1 Tax=Zychaea mexicana TaxID=64656 RepID=UPI0022FDC4D6|nr:uncharacterized protein BDB00DRAFT_870427 [Zychaea mexicana]KAI9495578.1 hypothetical protein BDB00DRAFT_870427 [Zychaea mexicana]